ncbi:MAG TPA: FAD-binding oxidoreductase, partial [Bacteroidales bacterium]|nr:FAD-binding oxidoreductase [Bacteroidales bacterium]
MEHTVKILKTENITHDVKHFVLEKPEGYSFESGQATALSINKKGYENEKRPFTFTSLNSDPHLELIIKIYDDHNGVTKKLGKLQESDELIIGAPWGTINYKGSGYFIAGGAGITPFIAILRHLQKENQLKIDTEGGDADVFALASCPGALCISLLAVRQGRLLGARHYTPGNGLDLDAESLLGDFVSQYYLGQG